MSVVGRTTIVGGGAMEPGVRTSILQALSVGIMVSRQRIVLYYGEVIR